VLRDPDGLPVTVLGGLSAPPDAVLGGLSAPPDAVLGGLSAPPDAVRAALVNRLGRDEAPSRPRLEATARTRIALGR
jgi:hypothetical protein